MGKRTILMSGIGGAVATQIAKYLFATGHKIIGVDCDRYTNALCNRTVCHKSEIIVPVTNKNYFKELTRIYKKYRCDLLIVTNEIELEKCTKHNFDKSINILIPPFKFFNLVNSKYNTFKILENENIVPKTIKINKEIDLDKAPRQLGLPFWIRKDRGQAAPNAYKAHLVKKAKQWIDFKDGWGEFIASEYLPGRNVAWVTLYKDGKPISAIGYERLAYLNPIAAQSGITGTAAVCLTTRDRKYMQITSRAIEAIEKHLNFKLTGLITVDFKDNKREIPKITEINPRPSNTFPFGPAGCRIIDYYIAIALNKKFKACSNSRYGQRDVYYLRAVDLEPMIIPKQKI